MIKTITLLATSVVAYLAFMFFSTPKDEYASTPYEETKELVLQVRQEGKAVQKEREPFGVPEGENFVDVSISEDKKTYTVWSQHGEEVVVRVFDRETNKLLEETRSR